MSMADCVCKSAGYCRRWRRKLNEREHEVCSNTCPPDRPCSVELREQYFELWAKWRLPAFVTRLVNFTRSTVRHILHGLPTVSAETLNYRWSYCGPCEYHRDGACAKCGCKAKGEKQLVNKLQWAGESCPEKKWGPAPGEKIWQRWWRIVTATLANVSTHVHNRR